MMKRYLLFNDGALCFVLFGVQLSINYIWTDSAVYADQCTHTFHAHGLTLVSFSLCVCEQLLESSSCSTVLSIIFQIIGGFITEIIN